MRFIAALLLAWFAGSTTAHAQCADKHRDARGDCVRPKNQAGCPEGMVLVRRGTFAMGSGDVGSSAFPEHRVTLSAYCIDKTEVSVKQYAVCVAAKHCEPPTNRTSGTWEPEVELWSRFCNTGKEKQDHPINCIGWAQATSYCRWAKKRLPTEAEWEYAARGSDRRSFPWGNEAPDAKRVNACAAECVAMSKRLLERSSWKGLHAGDDGWESTAPVASFPGDTSPFGVLDLAGNVAEWTADWYGAYRTEPSTNPRGAPHGRGRVFRGGSWQDQTSDRFETTSRWGDDPHARSPALGFRCALTPR